MGHSFKLFILLTLIFHFLAAGAEIKKNSKKVVTLRGDDWCPYNCDPSSGFEGFMVDIAREILEPSGYVVDYQILNWTRAKKEVSSGLFSGLVGASHQDGPTLIFPKSELGRFSSTFITLKDSKFRFSGKKSLESIRWGVVSGYTYGQNADQMIASAGSELVRVSGDDALPILIKMLENKRIDTFYESPLVLSWKLKAMGKARDGYFDAGSMDSTHENLYIAFSNKDPEAAKLARLLDEGMQNLRKTKRLNVILSKYGLEDWEK